LTWIKRRARRIVRRGSGHDTPAEIAQGVDVKDWARGECEAILGKAMPTVTVVERDYPNLDTIGTSRDECVIVRKMAKVDSLDQPLAAAEAGGEHG
jgi:nitrate reductase alpha subunit